MKCKNAVTEIQIWKNASIKKKNDVKAEEILLRTFTEAGGSASSNLKQKKKIRYPQRSGNNRVQSYLKCFITVDRFKAFRMKRYRYDWLCQWSEEAQEGDRKSNRHLRIPCTWRIWEIIASVKALQKEFRGQRCNKHSDYLTSRIVFTIISSAGERNMASCWASATLVSLDCELTWTYYV